MTVIFDGREFAREKEELIRDQVNRLIEKGITPKLASIIIGDDPASILYVNLKKKAAERVGAEVEIIQFKGSEEVNRLIKLIKGLNRDTATHGIMVQLPLPDTFSKSARNKIINAISSEKDVDGLQKDSKFIPPTAMAVQYILSEVDEFVHFKDYPIVISVVGAKGFIGRQIVSALENMYLNGYEIIAVDRKTANYGEVIQRSDVVISVTGSPGIIGGDDIKKDAVVIDVGSPKGDVRTEEVLGKAAFISPVPGGVGPVTISCLLENLVEAATVGVKK